MAEYAEDLNGLFQALGNPTRRGILARLARGPASISDLAEPFDMALPSFMKHIRQLEECGWISSRKEGRTRTCAIESERFEAVEGWLAEQKKVWEERTDRMEQFVLKQEEERK
ncbi:MAG: helix-turn-helix transcriptional regulator [Solirubrobacterales bacterium]|nr:helix-turn-helix transcriptional regulator [Solirubrobacterales bacterium]